MVMRCHVCNVAVSDGQRFCHECGESLDGVTNPTETHDVIADDAATLGVEADITDDEVTVETGRTDDADEPLLNSEMVTPPTQPEPEPEPEPTHRGTLPDLAAPPMGPDNDASWWAAGGGAPEPVDDLPGTEPVEVFAASPPIPEDATLASTEAMAVTPAHLGATGNSLDSVPYEPMDQAPVVGSVPMYEPTTTMPATATPDSSGLGATDQVAQHPPGGIEPTSEMLATQHGGLFDGASDAHEHASPSEGFRLRASFVFGLLAMVATLMASVADVIDIRTTRPVDGIIVGIRALDDFGSNLAVAGFIGAALMLIGGLLSCFGLRWGSGVAGGAGLSMTGWAAVTLGLVETPIHAAEGVTLNANEVTTFTLSVTRDLGYFLILAIGILGVVVFLVSLRMAGTGGRGGLNPWIAAVGALSSVVMAAGPLITLAGASLDANFGTIGIPKEFFAGRLVQLGLLVVTGVIGFLSVRTYGLGLAAGGLGVATWMWVTSLAEVGDLPVSIAIGNLGTRETTPHAVTTVGVTASLALLLIAATMATVTRPRPRA
jgi:hypothetical protein